MLEERDIAVVKMPHMLQENSYSVHTLGVNLLTLSLSGFFCFFFLLPVFIQIYSVPVLRMSYVLKQQAVQNSGFA